MRVYVFTFDRKHILNLFGRLDIENGSGLWLQVISQSPPKGDCRRCSKNISSREDTKKASTGLFRFESTIKDVAKTCVDLF